MFDGNKITHTPKRVCVILHLIKGNLSCNGHDKRVGAYPRVAPAPRGKTRALRGLIREKQKSDGLIDPLLFCSVVALVQIYLSVFATEFSQTSCIFSALERTFLLFFFSIFSISESSHTRKIFVVKIR